MPLCGSWQFAHRAWPVGAVLASGAWQVAHAAGEVLGWCGPAVWQLAQLVWPLRTSLAFWA